ncbi:hypothetical protein GDO78_023206 [Eleutherodactylus coqui]|uniref:Uncharacterized protein n=1 Tax=Eleutherodactylus coqui TaxID=57060 RepID=A0A8J6E722_ELECQ|nr:hypothetical protein GDO78_023206 [Eleutherodactylus coqui]
MKDHIFNLCCVLFQSYIFFVMPCFIVGQCCQLHLLYLTLVCFIYLPEAAPPLPMACVCYCNLALFKQIGLKCPPDTAHWLIFMIWFWVSVLESNIHPFALILLRMCVTICIGQC